MAGLDPAVGGSRTMHGGWVYIMTNRPEGTLYIGVTADLARRIQQHKEGIVPSSTARYGLKRLVYVERHDDIKTAIQRETSLKRWPRAWKIDFIVKLNPGWEDLSLMGAFFE